MAFRRAIYVTHSTPSPPDPEVVAALPHVFIDRSLGAVQVPALLRAVGVSLTTMREHYGEAAAQGIADQEWITLTAQHGWIAFHKDDSIRRNEVERQTVLATGARMFCVPRADITAGELALRFTNNLAAIANATQSPGPFIYLVYPNDITQLV